MGTCSIEYGVTEVSWGLHLGMVSTRRRWMFMLAFLRTNLYYLS